MLDSNTTIKGVHVSEIYVDQGIINGPIFAAYTPYGIQRMESKLAGRIQAYGRVNVVLRPAEQGGIFLCNGAWVNFPRFKFFRPDQLTHGVSKIEKGERLVLSIGWVRS